MTSIRFGSNQNHLLVGNSLLRCYILENMERVITINSIQKTLGYDGKSENWLSEFLTTINKFTPIYTELIAHLNNSELEINFSEGQKLPIKTVESKFLLEACIAIIKAKNEGFLNVSQLKHSKAASTLLENIGNSNINDLIDEATGFLWYKKNALDTLVQQIQQHDKAYIWIKTIPNDFIETLLEMNSLEWENVNHNPNLLSKIIHELLYSRIEINFLEELRITKPKRIYKRKNNQKQDIEHQKLKEYLSVLQSLLKASGENWNIFMQLLNKTYPKQKNRETIFFLENKNNTTLPLSDFNEKLKTVLFRR